MLNLSFEILFEINRKVFPFFKGHNPKRFGYRYNFVNNRL